MRKLTYIAIAIFLGVPALAFAAFDDATLTTATVISVGGISLNVSGSSAVVESITVDTSSFTFVLRSGSSIQVTSPDRKVLSTNATSQFVQTNTCNSTESVLKHGGYTGSGTLTVTVTPSSSTCTGGAATASTGGGGGVLMSCNPGYRLSGSSCVPISAFAQATPSTPANPPKPAQTAAGVSAVFSINLRPGIQSDDVRRLQTLLATDPGVYPEGTVTGYYGSKTREAVGRFQIKHGVVASATAPGYGAVGPKTRMMLQEVFGGAEPPIPPQPAAAQEANKSTTSAIFTVTLRIGMQSEDVRRLQELLAMDPEVYPEASITGYYGPLTKKAVERFQLKYAVVSSSSEAGFGTVGPKTRAALEQVFK